MQELQLLQLPELSLSGGGLIDTLKVPVRALKDNPISGQIDNINRQLPEKLEK
jgi:hypothetical protein